jgi:hypothetical protein
LIDYHIEWYTQHTKDIQTINNVPDAYNDVNGNLRLSSRKKRDILVNNIYGVDIDRQAVEVTQMSLYLRVLENENADTLNPQMTLALKEVYLPSLADNIKCGNSLIGTDFGAQGEMFDDGARMKINPFDWEMEFKEIFSPSSRGRSSDAVGTEGVGGFDCVIGNPPYLSATELEDYQKYYYKEKYSSAIGRIDTYGLFIEKALSLTVDQSRIGYIIPNKFLTNVYFSTLRALILNSAKITSLDLFKDSVFSGAAVNSVVVALQKERRKNVRDANLVAICESDEFEYKEIRRVEQSVFMSDQQKRYLISSEGKAHDVIMKVNSSTAKLKDLFDVRDGIIAGRIKDLLFLDSAKNKFCKKLVFGGDMFRYTLDWRGKWVNYQPEKMNQEERERVRKGGIGLRLRTPEIFETTKILTRKTADRIIATLDDHGYYFEQTVHGSILRDKRYSEKYFLALLNSKLYLYYYQKEMNQEGTIFPQVRIGYLKELPICTIDFTNLTKKNQHDALVGLVDRMLDLHKQLVKSNFDSEKEPIERQIKATDKKIDQLVYQLYGLTEEEIKVVEGKNGH